MSNKIREVPDEKTFLCALKIINDAGYFYWQEEEVSPIISREMKRLNQEKVSSFGDFSLSEVIDSFADTPLPSSSAQVVVMNEVVRRLKTFSDFQKVYDENRNPNFFSTEWAREHQRIFLCAWLSVCRDIDHDICYLWSRVAGQRCYRYARFLMLKRAAEILAEGNAT